MKVVHVKWIDPAFASSGWMLKSEFIDFTKRQPTPADSVGLLAFENDEFIIVLQTIGLNQVADAVKIVRSCIKEIRELADVDIELELEGD